MTLPLHHRTLQPMGTAFGARRYHFDWRGFITPGVKLLVLVCSGVYVVQVVVSLLTSPSFAYHHITQVFGLIPSAVIPGLRIWQPFTYLFFHDPGSIWHILINMLMLWMFGRDLELAWGKRRFLTYFIICGVGAGVIEIFVKIIPEFWGHHPSDIPTIGASGAIFGILMANAILFPDRRIWLIPLPVTIPMRPYVAAMGAIEFLMTIGTGGDGIGHICHLGGMLVGYLYLRRGSFLYNVRNSVSDWKYQRNRKRFQVYMNRHKNEPPSRPDRWVN